jgi:hypothetical protein
MFTNSPANFAIIKALWLGVLVKTGIGGWQAETSSTREKRNRDMHLVAPTSSRRIRSFRANLLLDEIGYPTLYKYLKIIGIALFSPNFPVGHRVISTYNISHKMDLTQKQGEIT